MVPITFIILLPKMVVSSSNSVVNNISIFGRETTHSEDFFFIMAAHLSEKEIAKIKRQFLVLDKDGSGEISEDELRGIFQDPRLKMTEEDIDKLFTEFDLDGSGLINISEFLILMSNRENKELKELVHRAIILRSAIRKAFREFDKNGDGWINKKEFKSVMRIQKARMTETQIDAMVKVADRNGDGKIDYDEFLLAMTK